MLFRSWKHFNAGFGDTLHSKRRGQMTPKLARLEELLRMHPKGTHFCMATQQEGFALDAELLLDLINKLKVARKVLQDIEMTPRVAHFKTDQASWMQSQAKRALEEIERE